MRALASFADRNPVLWANGAGQTTELVSLADSAQLTPGLRPWRLSIARLEHVGPFSALPGMARTFQPTAEVALEIDGHMHRVPALRPVHFHGEQNVSLVDLADPCFAVNLMVADDSTDDVACDAGADTGVGSGADSGTGSGRESESASGELQMCFGRPVPADGIRLVLTVEADVDFPRFQLFELDPGEAVPDEIPVVVLHAGRCDARN
ncbi:MAG: HutD family protein [Brevibacterium sp.]|uniref:HutD family protein n=1 Tax=Brevibacterium sp. TaxID=1701 RepID=UPI003F934827